LDKAGIKGSYEGACALAEGSIVGRTHFARFLVEQGHARDVRQVFKRYLVNNKPGFVSGEWASLEAVLDWISRAGGMAVIAHPARYRMTASKLRRLVGEFRECGGLGMEVIQGMRRAWHGGGVRQSHQGQHPDHGCPVPQRKHAGFLWVGLPRA